MTPLTRREFAGVVAALSSAASADTPQAAAMEEGPVPGIQSRRDAKPRVLAVIAHPADFCSRAGGTLIKHVKAGCAVRVV